MPVNHLIELVHNAPIIAAYCIATADRTLGRLRYDQEEKHDRAWWKAHNAAMVEMFGSASKAMIGLDREMQK